MRSILIFLSLFSTVHLWNYHTHLLSTRIAHDYLLENSPEVVQKVEDQLRVLTQTQPHITEDYEDQHPFVECAVVADGMKYKGWSWQSDWHYSDAPYYDQGEPTDYPEFELNPLNTTERLYQLIAWLQNDTGYQDTESYQKIVSHYTEEEGRSIALRIVIHLMGDLHQPLHNIARVNDDYLEGDKGGNEFPLKKKYSVENLHQLWDKVIYETRHSVPLPFTDESWAEFGEEAQDYMLDHYITDEERQFQDYYQISEQGYTLAISNSYQGIEENESVPTDYIDVNVPVAERQFVLAGMRLAYLLETIYKVEEKDEHRGHPWSPLDWIINNRDSIFQNLNDFLA